MVALRWLWGGYRLAFNTLCCGFDVALMWLWGGLAVGYTYDVELELEAARRCAGG